MQQELGLSDVEYQTGAYATCNMVTCTLTLDSNHCDLRALYRCGTPVESCPPENRSKDRSSEYVRRLGHRHNPTMSGPQLFRPPGLPIYAGIG